MEEMLARKKAAAEAKKAEKLAKASSKKAEKDTKVEVDMFGNPITKNPSSSYKQEGVMETNSLGRTEKTEEWKRILQEEESNLKKLGLEIREMEGDGACLFRAFADQLLGDSSKHQDLRNECVEFLKNHEEEYKWFVDDMPYKEYVKMMKDPLCWGGDLEIQALARLKEINVVVHIPSTYDTKKKPSSNDDAVEETTKQFSKLNVKKDGFAFLLDEQDDDAKKEEEKRKEEEKMKQEEIEIVSAETISEALKQTIGGQTVEMVNFDLSKPCIQLAYHPHHHLGRHYNVVVIGESRSNVSTIPSIPLIANHICEKYKQYLLEKKEINKNAPPPKKKPTMADIFG